MYGLPLIGRGPSRRIKNEEDYFLAGRWLGKFVQTFAAFCFMGCLVMMAFIGLGFSAMSKTIGGIIQGVFGVYVSRPRSLSSRIRKCWGGSGKMPSAV